MQSNKEEKCMCHSYWKRLEQHIVAFLDSNTLFDLCEETRNKKLSCSVIE